MIVYTCHDIKCSMFGKTLEHEEMKLHIKTEHKIDANITPFAETGVSFLDMKNLYQNIFKCEFQNGYTFYKQVTGKRTEE